MNALELLKKDHKEVRALLEELVETTPRATRQRQELLETLEQQIKVHTKIEEEIFYPAFRKAASTKQDEQLYYEAWEEHRAADMVLKDLKKADFGSPEFGGRAKVLCELVNHHADEEEEELFSKAKKLMSKDQLEELGEQLQKRKEKLLQARGNGQKEARA